MTTPGRMALRHLLVASDTSPASDAAMRVARLLAERDGAQVSVIGVYCPPVPLPESAHHHPEARDESVVHDLLARLQRQTREYGGADWPVHVVTGAPPVAIAAFARRLRADLVLLGHSARESDSTGRRTRHTAEQVAGEWDVPVMSVPAGVSRLPRGALVVKDDSKAARRIVAVAGALIESGGTVHETRGPVSESVLGLAEAVGAELVAVPLPGHTFAVRWLMGAGVVDVLEHARCSVVVAPSAAVSETSDDQAAGRRNTATARSARS